MGSEVIVYIVHIKKKIMSKKKEIEEVEIQEEFWIPFTEVNPEIGLPIRVKFVNGTIVDGCAVMTSLGYLVETNGTREDYESGLLEWTRKNL